MDTRAKNYKNWLTTQKARATKGILNNMEVEAILDFVLNKFNEFYPDKIIRNEIRILNGWKGKGTIEIYNGFNDDFIIVEYIKDKHNGDIIERRIEIQKNVVNNMVRIIKGLPLNKPVTCYDIAYLLGYQDWKDLWKERKIYFMTYYYPIKILEALEVIKYGGKGKVTRLI